jgi:UDP-2,4-diacetamido-2,4,6-trideoxy-beta-L-altropyranose hydrolase
LADALRAKGADCVFLSRDHFGHLHRIVEARGYDLLSLGAVDPVTNNVGTTEYADWLGVDVQRDADESSALINSLKVDWMIVDHYALDCRWEQTLSSKCGRIMAIDDLANRDHAVDALLDQNLGKTPVDYEARTPPSCRLMLGPHYALLRPEFATLRAASLSRRKEGQFRNLLVTMGGVDQENTTGVVLEALNDWAPSLNFEVTVVLGPSAPWCDKVIQQAQRLSFPTKVLVNVQNIANLMYSADLAIGAAGSTSWERCCLGLPALQMVLADNQRSIATALSQEGAALLLERVELSGSLNKAINQFVGDRELLCHMSAAAAKLVDGRGAERVAQFLMEGL